MTHVKLLSSLLVAGTVVMALQVPASAQMRTSRSTAQAPAAGTGNMVGIGYKAGNGLGFTGLDLIVNPSPNMSLDLQAGLTPTGAFGVAPAIQFHMPMPGMALAGGPYLGAGVSYTPTSTGVFGNVGYQLMPMPNVGLLLGVGYLQPLSGGAGGVNYEFGLRYFFM